MPLPHALLASVLATSTVPALDVSIAKQVTAPAADIASGRVRLPDPRAGATTSAARLVPLAWTRTASGTWRAPAPLDASTGSWSCAWIANAPIEPAVRVSHAGVEVPLEAALGATPFVARSDAWTGGPLVTWGTRWDVAGPAPAAEEVVLELDASATPPTTSYWVQRDAHDVVLSAWATTFATTSDRPFGFAACLSEGVGSSAPVDLRRASGALDVTTPRGTLRLALVDDGAHADGAAEDGVFGAWLPAGLAGDVRVHAELRGITRDGRTVTRSAVVQVPVLERRVVLDGDVGVGRGANGTMRIELGASPAGPAAKLQVAAEVWGTTAAGEWVPVAWLARMVTPTDATRWRLPLEFDPRTLAANGARPPLALHAVRVQDPDTHVVLDEVDWLPLDETSVAAALGTSQATAAPGPSALPAAPTGAVASLVVASPLPPAPSSSVLGPPVPGEVSIAGSARARHLMLVHGYCSSGSIWPAADFSAPKVEFLDPNQNRTHDQFALLLRARMSERNSFGVVGHSQGGPAALHLYTYYVSALDFASGGRRIQSVASPYQGTPLASLGFFACGVNNDMTPAGSTAWLAGIPTWARAEVWYWTTSDAGSACNFLTGLILTNPEDGTVEQSRGQLPGATSMGHVTGWCHTTGMSYPANYTDHARNAVMNTNAAR